VAYQAEKSESKTLSLLKYPQGGSLFRFYAAVGGGMRGNYENENKKPVYEMGRRISPG
jgi:hypothetical protein